MVQLVLLDLFADPFSTLGNIDCKNIDTAYGGCIKCLVSSNAWVVYIYSPVAVLSYYVCK